MKTKYLFKSNNIKQYWHKINKYDNYFLFLDYDGTLANFREDPTTAYPYPGICNILHKLNKFSKVNICLISGRPIQQLKNFIDLPNLYYAGLHGLQLKGINTNIIADREKEQIQQLKHKLKEYINNEQIMLEDKTYVLTIHYPSDFNQQNKLLSYISKHIDENYEIISGRKNIEVRPKGWNKGKAVQLLLDKITKAENNKPLTIYIGDDTTDEDAFKVISGISIYVKNNDSLTTAAEYYVNNPKEVYELLTKLNEQFSN